MYRSILDFSDALEGVALKILFCDGCMSGTLSDILLCYDK